MSFHNAQPHKSSSSDSHKTLAGWSPPLELTCEESASVAASDQGLSASSGYDEEVRFELLSAYIDDEVSSEERQLVAQWLMYDPNMQQMYQRLLRLRQAIRTAPVPEQPPLQVPGPSHQSWATLSTRTLHRALVCALAIALLGGFTQFSTTTGRQQLKEAWQFIKSLPQGTLIELASTTNAPSVGSIK
ncbi:hypothetical protein N836_07835 [Leptolyngbya sp. Heron Island J]|uniref:anti-sigma factor family protein n=1 Tax=Leptolyngbya sp. Heron Island J TaxID=1385935 RepID=UPI0003B9F8B9|nr:hypothetical protein [Leptolyngbya sp. Heron Island J]ESA36243.1 hypothetical protein N836_07835 [Leptolyngbya sp. Heron Island J]